MRLHLFPKILSGLLVGSCLLATPLQAAALKLPEHVAKCYENYLADEELIECFKLEAAFWEQQIKLNYQLAAQACTKVAVENIEEASAQQEFASSCRVNLEQNKQQWPKFRDSMAQVQCDLFPFYGGIFRDLGCAQAYTTIVKEQALKLWAIYGNEQAFEQGYGEVYPYNNLKP